MLNNKRAYLRVSQMLLIVLVLVSYQNCGTSNSSDTFSSHQTKKYAHLSVEAREQMLLAEDEIRNANLDVGNFIDVLSEVQKLIEYINAHPLKKPLEGEANPQVSQQIFMENLGIQVNLMGHFLNALNSIPNLNPDQMTSLSRAIERIKAIEGLGPTENFLLSLLTVIELKQIILTYFFPQGATTTVPIGTPAPDVSGNLEYMQNSLRLVEKTLTVFSESMTIARPSMTAELEKFQQTFLTVLKQVTLLTVNK